MYPVSAASGEVVTSVVAATWPVPSMIPWRASTVPTAALPAICVPVSSTTSPASSLAASRLPTPFSP